jgi:hypothetical protein
VIIMKNWLIDTLARTVKTFAQSLVALLGAGQAGVVHTSLAADLSVAGMAAAVCILHNIQSMPLGSVTPNALGTSVLLDPVGLDAGVAATPDPTSAPLPTPPASPAPVDPAAPQAPTGPAQPVPAPPAV